MSHGHQTVPLPVSVHRPRGWM